MDYNRVGRSGLMAPAIGLGCMAFGRWIDREQSHEVIRAALDAGVTLFDTADLYGRHMNDDPMWGDGFSEAVLGEALAEHRHRVTIATKVYFSTGPGVMDAGLSRRHIIDACEASLRRLKTDYIDLYQIHTYDDETPIEETMSALNELVRQGKVRYVGCSNLMAWQIGHANAVSERRGFEPFVSLQQHYNLLARDCEQEIVPYCQAMNVGMLVYSPLARGLLAHPYQLGQESPPSSRLTIGDQGLDRLMTPRNLRQAARIRAYARQAGYEPAAFALAWVLSQPVVSSALVGASRPEQIVAAVANWRGPLADEHLRAVESLLAEE